jgi:hypothetical protein
VLLACWLAQAQSESAVSGKENARAMIILRCQFFEKGLRGCAMEAPHNGTFGAFFSSPDYKNFPSKMSPLVKD